MSPATFLQSMDRRTLAARGSAALLLTTWTIVLAAAFWPGILTTDSLDMLRMGTSGAYGTQHSALLSWIFGLVFKVTGATWPIYLAQVLTLGVGMLALVWRSHRPWLGTAVLAAFLLTPSVWSTEVAVWKDIAMAAALLLAVVALDYDKPWPAVVLLLLAGTFRLNALSATLPLLVPAIAQIPALARSRRRAVGAFVGLALCAVLAPKVVNAALSAKESHTVVWVVAYDLAGIYVDRPAAFTGSVLSEYVDVQTVPRIYDPTSSAFLFYGDPAIPRIPLDKVSDRQTELVAEWRRVVTAYPGTYLANRFYRFARFIGATGDPVHYAFAIGMNANPYGFKLTDHTLVHRGLRAVQEATRNTVFFRGWFWALALVALGAFAARRRGVASLPLWTASSGFAYLLGYLAAGPAADFRYMFWTLVSAFAAAAVALPRASGEPGVPGQ